MYWRYCQASFPLSPLKHHAPWLFIIRNGPLHWIINFGSIGFFFSSSHPNFFFFSCYRNIRHKRRVCAVETWVATLRQEGIVMKNFMWENHSSKYTVVRDCVRHCQLIYYKMLLELTNNKECRMLSTGCLSFAAKIFSPISEM